MSTLEVLKSVPGFGLLGENELNALADALLVTKHAAGHVIIEEGKPGNSIFVVLEGEIDVTHVRGGASFALNTMRPGDLFGLVALIDDHRRSATCAARTEATVGELPHSVFSLLFNSHAAVAYAFQEALGAQLARDFRGLDRQIRAEIEAAREAGGEAS